MALVNALMGIGTPPESALRTGFQVRAVTGVGTTQGGAAITLKAGNLIVNLTTAVGQTATTLPSDAEVGSIVVVNVLTATAGLVFPSSGQTIANKAADASATVAIGALFIKTTTTQWAAIGAA